MTRLNRAPNRLIKEKSPYLLQHAYNPVDWYPWGGEAFNKAKAEDKPIFLSIGYSTCHWCHVMEEESFSDDEVGAILNKNYISIKVDREERPDIDHIYMNYCQAMTGSGGWPMTIIMAPDQKPFFAGTYFPKNSQRGMPGLIDILDEIAHLWKSDRDKLYDIKDEAHRIIDPMFSIEKEEESLSEDIIHKTFKILDRSYDNEYGGFGRAPKFPMANYLMFLLRYHAYTDSERALEIVEESLKGMYRGGIFDHIGGGFCRYSTDRRWLVPHFEKMLYDNALLAISYLECYLITKDKFYANVAHRIFDYIIRDMSSSEGGFYTAEDADSEGVEGKFYVFIPEEIEKILGAEDARRFCQFYNISERGNFGGKSILNRLNSEDMLEPDGDMIELRQRVFAGREKRIRPFRDEKILVGWNGLMIAALAMGARILGDDKLLTRAIEAVDFIMKSCRDEKGRLYGSYIDGELSGSGYAHDYSYLIWGLIELYETCYDSQYLEYALELTDDMLEIFYDREEGGLFLYGTDDEQLVHRPKDIYDGALPSSNSIATYNLLRLASLTGNRELYNIGVEQFETFRTVIRDNPDSYTAFLISFMFEVFPSSEIVLVGRRDDYVLRQMIEQMSEDFMPGGVSLVVFEGEDNRSLAQMSPFSREYRTVDGKSAAYICSKNTCRPPITDMESFTREIQNL